MSTPVIIINPSKETILNFTLDIDGIDVKQHKPIVRFMVDRSEISHPYIFSCDHVKNKEWKVIIPPLTHLKHGKSVSFHIEIIVDGYYFNPVQGNLSVVTDPEVVFNNDAKIVKPEVIVTTENSIDLPVVANRTTEDPTINVTTEEIYIPDTPIKEIDNQIEPESLSVAQNIISTVIGRPQKVLSGTGTLFKYKNGRPVVAGLELPETVSLKEANAQKVRDILKDS